MVYGENTLYLGSGKVKLSSICAKWRPDIIVDSTLPDWPYD